MFNLKLFNFTALQHLYRNSNNSAIKFIPSNYSDDDNALNNSELSKYEINSKFEVFLPPEIEAQMIEHDLRKGPVTLKKYNLLMDLDSLDL